MITVNQLTAIAATLFFPWTGAWRADVDLDLDDTMVVPSGRVVLTIGENILSGTVDDRASGPFGNVAKLRIVGGGGGWEKDVPGQHFHNDAGVTSTVVRAATAAIVGEVVVEVVPPTVLGVDYDRIGGPAGRVLPPGGWYVTAQGITTVGPRVLLPFDPTSVSILSFDPLTQRAELASDTLVAPGTIIVDPKFGTITVRDVEQTFSTEGSRTTAWCSSSSTTRAAAALAKFAREATKVHTVKRYVYRVVLQNADGRLILQAADPSSGAPDLTLVSPWYGVPGFSAKFATTGALVAVDLLEGDPSKPVAASFDGSRPIQVSCGLGTSPVALSIGLLAAITALEAQVQALTIGLVALTTKPDGSPLAPMTPAHQTVTATAATAVQNQNTPLANAVAQIPSHLLFSE